MNTKILDYFPPILISLYCSLFNKCLTAGLYPNALKKVKVQPVYKGKGEMHVLKFFRPISQIPITSKIFERLISDRLMRHLQDNALMNEQQYAYQCGKSTVDAARDMLSRVMSHLEGRRQVAAIFCDLSRAFELVNHSLLLEKLKAYGVEGNFFSIVSEFLQNRQQCTSVRNIKSDLEYIGDSAVPQGSVMGNNLFLLLVNDLTTASDEAEYVLFADDGCVIVAADKFHELKDKITKVMASLANWFGANGMLLNVEKTNIMHFQRRRVRGHDLDVMCNGQPVPQVDQVKYLGFTVDSALTWSAHIDLACGRLASACFALSRLTPSLSLENLKKAYYGYFHSILTYGIDVWGDAADAYKIFKKQKRAVRIIAGTPWDHHARDLFVKYKILTAPCLYILEVAKYARRNLNSLQTIGDTHNINTRQRHRLCTPARRLAKSDKTLGVLAPKVYNALPSDIKSAPSDAVFIAKLKKLLVGNPVPANPSILAVLIENSLVLQTHSCNTANQFLQD
ncbi:unnamed protein product [Plutella xylostella]|uniref:(diamondback moth) hypothetical protein n=1 Tax=Plutella xylostella TaxID=51655 RepID=A0A8S4DIQ3_PLUXY|nr:unnamed protein product [Plutella xylostella]